MTAAALAPAPTPMSVRIYFNRGVVFQLLIDLSTDPDQFGKIYLCGAFWNAPNTGTDSKAGTLIHESSHFTVNGGTSDWAYGQSDCKSLAISNPARAIDNADSHEYFAENRPAL